MGSVTSLIVLPAWVYRYLKTPVMITCIITRFRQIPLSVCVCFAACLGSVPPAAHAEIKPDFLMDSDPKLQLPKPVKNFDPNLTALWMEALKRPEIDMQRMAAETIARAHLRGFPDLAKAVPRLEEILLADASHPAARFAAARALIVLESRDLSDKLFEASQTYGTDLRQLIEPALAVWDNASAKAVWIERLGSAETRPRDLILAVRGLGKVREQSTLPGLLSITNDLTRNSSVRLEAASSAGKIAETGLEQDAKRLARNARTPLFVNQLCAIRLLAHHSSEGAKQLLIELASHDEPAVAAAALQRLNEIDYSLVLPLAETAIRNSDPQVRRQGAMCLLRIPAVSHIAPLSQLLADPHPGLRREVCEGLYELSEKPGFSEPILDAAMRVLAGDKWQGHEQAALLLGTLEHKPAADRLVELLESPRVEVRIPAVWALRKVAVPKTIPALIDQARRLTERRRNENQPGLDEQVAHLFEALGVLRAKDAMPLLLEYVPKTWAQKLSRGAAFWAIGRLKEGTRDAKLEAALAERILDFEPSPSEKIIVKEMSAIALGRMQAVDQAKMMRQYAMGDYIEERLVVQGRLKLALGWAIRELTGEELPPPKPLTVSQGSWFLEPLP